MVQVKISEGLLEGEVVQNEYGGTYCSFKGIPYAQPPIGNLRFQAPQPPKHWQGVRSAKEFGSKSIQYDYMTNAGVMGSEDCLYLNVYTPDVKPVKSLPVMFWVHGGGFVCGSGEDEVYSPEFLVRQGVILVTINYRLEVLGFLCLNTEDVPGNAGIKDQVAALRWVNKNISNFGGDPNNITIFGESAGGASISYLMISPMTKGLFQRAIPQSGTALNHWAQARHPRERALALARQLGCYSEDDKELFEFFKNTPAEKLIQISAPIYLFEKAKNLLTVTFTVVEEKKFENNERFFAGDYSAVHEGIDIMIGYNSDEGMVVVPVADIPKKLGLARDFPEDLVPPHLTFTLPVTQQLEMGNKIKKYYFNDKTDLTDDWEGLMRFGAMDMFVLGIIHFAKICAKRNKVYLYKFSCKSERNLFKQILGLTDIVGDKPVTSHADDLMYLFNAKLVPDKVDANSDTFKLIDRLTTLWTNFAKYGNPTPDDSLGAKWIQYSEVGQDYLDIGNELVAGTAPDAEEIQMWDQLIEEYGRQCY